MDDQGRPVFLTVGDNPTPVFGLDPKERACRLATNAGLECVEMAQPGRSQLLANLDFAWDPAWLRTMADRPGSVLELDGQPVIAHVPLGHSRAPVEQAMLGNGGSLEGILAVHSTSKRSNLAGYRAAFVAGDASVVAELLAVRKHLGFLVPTPIQAALAAVLADDKHVDEQKARYRERRSALRKALERAGFGIDDSAGALYLWVTRDEPCRDTVAWLAERGILAAPGEFYGPKGARHVRVAFTATDERIATAVARLPP